MLQHKIEDESEFEWGIPSHLKIYNVKLAFVKEIVVVAEDEAAARRVVEGERDQLMAEVRNCAPGKLRVVNVREMLSWLDVPEPYARANMIRNRNPQISPNPWPARENTAFRKIRRARIAEVR